MNRIFELELLLQVFTVCLFGVTAAQAKGDQELLEFARDAHRAARESVQTFSGCIEFTIAITQESKSPVTHLCSSQYWISPKAMRARISENNEDTDFLWENSVRKSIIRRVLGGQPAASGGRHRYSHRHVMRCDPYVRGLLVLNLPNTTDYVPFEELVERATRLITSERKRVGGKDLITIQLFFEQSKKDEPAWTVDILFDSTVNYLIRQVAYTESNYRKEEEVLEFKEYQPGLFFPVQADGRSQILPGEAKLTEHKTKFSNVQINQPLPKNIFYFRYPHSVIVGDAIRGCEYRVDAEGNQISQETPYGREPPPPGNDWDAQAFGTETHEEPRPWSHWIITISFGILITGGVAAFLRRRRRQAESA